MGCWNETCGITQLPIHEGEPVVLVLLAANGDRARDHNGFCYSNAQWSPRFLPIFGIYDDYGGVEQIQENWNTQWIVNQMREELVETRLGLQPRSDMLRAPLKTEQLDLDSFTLYDVLEEIRNDAVWIPGITAPNPLGWMMIHGWVWDHMTQTMDCDWHDPKTIHQVEQEGAEYYQELCKMISANPKTFRVLGSMNPLVNYKNSFDPLTDRSGSRLDGYGLVRGIRSYNTLFEKYAQQQLTVDDPLVKDLIGAMSRFLTFRNNMSALRKFWSPQTGKGSQSENLEMHMALHKLAVEKIQQRLDYYSAQDDDDHMEE